MTSYIIITTVPHTLPRIDKARAEAIIHILSESAFAVVKYREDTTNPDFHFNVRDLAVTIRRIESGLPLQ